MTYFPAVQYHRQRWLNCCVRDGNRCFPALMFTDKPAVASFGASTRYPGVCGPRATGRMNMTRLQPKADPRLLELEATAAPTLDLGGQERPLPGRIDMQRARSVPNQCRGEVPLRGPRRGSWLV